MAVGRNGLGNMEKKEDLKRLFLIPFPRKTEACLHADKLGSIMR